MKKTLILFAGVLVFGLACNKNTDSRIDEAQDPAGTSRKCAAQDVLEDQLRQDPTLQGRMDAIEELTGQVVQHPERFRLVDGMIEIPVVFNVLYNTAAQNVSQAQLQSQVDILNQDFSARNRDYRSTQTYNEVKSGDIGIRFVLDGVHRRFTSRTSWQLNDAMKKSAQGILPTNPETKLNVWVCNLTGGYLGYAQFPGGKLETDGVVLDDNATGNTGTAEAPYDKGRTATHEVGHWLNLRHIWGDANCGTDLVDDTPKHNTYNFGCPPAGHLSTCAGTPVEMTMNYMDYTEDACMYMFSIGQKTRMLATFVAGGPRNSFAQP